MKMTNKELRQLVSEHLGCTMHEARSVVFEASRPDFNSWLAEQQQNGLPSSTYAGNDVDMLWENWRTGEWMYLETKRYMHGLTDSQEWAFCKLHGCGLMDDKYMGFYLVQFEKEGPLDGSTTISKLTPHAEEGQYKPKMKPRWTRTVTAQGLRRFLAIDPNWVNYCIEQHEIF